MPLRLTAALALMPISLVEPNGGGAKLEGDEQDDSALTGCRQSRGGGETADSAGAAEPEQWHPLCIVPEADPPRHQSLQAGRGDAGGRACNEAVHVGRSEEHTSELQSLMRISYA